MLISVRVGTCVRAKNTPLVNEFRKIVIYTSGFNIGLFPFQRQFLYESK